MCSYLHITIYNCPITLLHAQIKRVQLPGAYPEGAQARTTLLTLLLVVQNRASTMAHLDG
ncbi:hypothetical protein Taro_027969 [Colocasia esculenta]|uniref:Uncharacterized protein n=1 Tax=Colocasia esculenta TaxID=4460 RepID=A0A843VSW5_COLES|nr:hypothetical protein [Colocasia esculenta]